MTTSEIQDPREWRVSMSGYAIKAGIGDDKEVVVNAPRQFVSNQELFDAWLELAVAVCEARNKVLKELGV